MAISPLDQRLDALSKEQEQMDLRLSEAELPAPDRTLSSAIEQEAPVEEVDGVQVAGGRKSVIAEIVKGVSNIEIKKPPPSPVGDAAIKQDEQQVKRIVEEVGVPTEKEGFRPATTEDKKMLRVETKTLRAAEQSSSATVDNVLSEWNKIIEAGGVAGKKPPETAFNYNATEVADSTKALIEAISKVGGQPKKKITFAGVERDVEKEGYGIDFLDKLLSGKLGVDPKTSQKVANSYVAAVDVVENLMQKVASGNANPEEMVKVEEAVQLASLIENAAQGYITNVAQSLAILRNTRRADVQMSDVMAMVGEEKDIKLFAAAYINSKTPQARANLIKARAQGNTWEKVFGVYINGLLSRPGTHLRNALSNTVFIPYRLAERGIAAGIGGARKMIGLGSTDVYRFSETGAILASTPKAIMNGFQLAAHALKTGVPKDFKDPIKIARQQSRMELFNTKGDRSPLDYGLRALNILASGPGRALLTADQFFKGINYTHELAAEATRLHINTYYDALKAGKTSKEAEEMASKAADDLLNDPPESISQLAEVGTFTQKLEGSLGQVQANVQPNSAMKFVLRTQFPFIGTPVNIFMEYVSRTPLGLVSKNLVADLKKGGTKESDMALTKVGMGAGIMYSTSQLAVNGNITGSGPGDRGIRQTMERQGWRPYSVIVDVSNLTEEDRQSMSKFPLMTSMGSGDYEGKLFISYQGIEPVGALLAAGADYADYVRYEQDDSRVNAVLAGYVFGIGNYMLTHPFMQGAFNIVDILGGNVPNTRENVLNILNGIGKLAGEVGGNLAQIQSGTVKSIAQQYDPFRRDYQINPNAPAGLKGLFDGFNKIKAQTPGLSEDFPPLLNIWGEPQKHEYTWSPLRMTKGTMREVDQALIQLGVSVRMPSREVSVADETTGITAKTKLTAQEYNQLLIIANDKLGLQDRVMAVINRYDNYQGKQKLDFQTAIKREFEDVFSDARKILAQQSDFSEDIKTRIAEKAAVLEEYGMGAK